MECTLIFLLAVYWTFHEQINSWFSAPPKQPIEKTEVNPPSKSKSLKNIKWILIGGGVFIYLLLLIVENSGNASHEPAVSDSQAVFQTQASDSESNTEPEIATAPIHVVLNRYSTGYDWKRADYQTKRQFCQTVAAAESREFNHDFTADFYMDALDGFYDDSSDPHILGENINRVVGMTTAVTIGNQ